MSKTWVWTVFLTLLAMVATAEQPISVNIDDQAVKFGAVGPQSVQGRVLVPLRGVLEKAGAYVDWSPATREVVAQRGDRTVVLKLGSTTATVNGQAVKLDVPAMSMSGTTMVPLRFLGEALGADVKWIGSTRTIDITTSGASNPPETNPETGQLEIQSFTHNATGWLVEGSTLHVTLAGTPAGTATFEIPGVLKQTKMQENYPGRYTGTWKVPPTAKSIANATVLGLLQVHGTDRLIQAGNSISIDTEKPNIKNLLPQPDSQVSPDRPSISAVLDDQAGSGIDTTKVTVSVDGSDVTDDSVATQSFISYRPTAKLAPGEHTVSITVTDVAGNAAKQTWKFAISTTVGAIKSFTFKADQSPAPGDVISARLEGIKGATAAFTFVDPSGVNIRTQAMQETSPGIYEGEYTVRKGDNLIGASVVGSVTTATGGTVTQTAEGKIGGAAAAPAKAAIKSPVEGEAAKSPLVITGKAAPKMQVHLMVDYATTLIVRIGGKLSDQLVDVNEKGEFASESIDLGGIIKGKNTEYTLTAIVISPDGKESEPVIVTFTRL